MPEILEIYNLKNKLIKKQTRDRFYVDAKKEFAKHGKISRKIKTIRLILMNSQGRIYLQKRSKQKNENPGLYDKTIGGHVLAGESFEVTLVRECAEELGFPATVLSPDEFKKAVKSTNLGIVGIFKKIAYSPNFQSVRLTKSGSKFVQPHMNTFYIGYYNGPIRFVDGESSGVEVFSLSELKQELKTSPEKFTEDIKFMIKKFAKYLKKVR